MKIKLVLVREIWQEVGGEKDVCDRAVFTLWKEEARSGIHSLTFLNV